MRLAAFDTALGACSVALFADGRVLAARREEMARGHAERLLPMAEEVLAEAGLGWTDLDRLAVTLGPGTFTGVRTGLAAARGLALALDLPLAGLNTLEVIAEGAAAARGDAPLVVILDAHGGPLYAQVFPGRGMPRVPDGLAAPGLHAPDALAAALVSAFGAAPGAGPGEGTTIDLAGNGADLFAPVLAAAGVASARCLGPDGPDAADLARLAARLPAPSRPYQAPAPLYLRAPDARPPAPRAPRDPGRTP